MRRKDDDDDDALVVTTDFFSEFWGTKAFVVEATAKTTDKQAVIRSFMMTMMMVG